MMMTMMMMTLARLVEIRRSRSQGLVVRHMSRLQEPEVSHRSQLPVLVEIHMSLWQEPENKSQVK